MGIKLTLLGLLIMAAMAAYAASAAALLCRRRGLGTALFVSGFALALSAFVVRWYEVAHIPMQNLFEVFLALGMLACPIAVFSRRFLGVGGEAGDAIVGFAVLFPAAFVFKAEPQRLPPALQSWLFAPHVAAYMLAYMILAKAGVQAMAQLFRKTGPAGDDLVPYETATYRMVRLGFPLLTLGLILGAVWGKIAWGDYWGWDPKELWSLVSWLVYVAYLHVRYMYGTRHPRLNSSLAVAGLLAIVITLLWVNLSSIFAGLHSYAS
jgi:ABC-type transport system involved in cytochrome c biogenesis permease subunit